MDIFSSYDLLLFDLDGLLIDTEHLHCRAYAQMCAKRGVQFPWDFPAYFRIAEKGGTAIRDDLYRACPDLQAQEPSWAVLYEEKRQALYALAESEPVTILPGVERLLMLLAERDIPRAIVTHSPRKLVEAFALQQPILCSIPVWFCREDYVHPKPHPDGYNVAIRYFNSPKRVLGFEDAVRGVQALLEAGADAVLVGHPEAETRAYWEGRGVRVIDQVDEVVSG